MKYDLSTLKPERTVAYLVRSRRYLAKKSLRDVYQETGISFGHLSNLETGKIFDLRAATVFRLCKALNIGVEAFCALAAEQKQETRVAHQPKEEPDS